MNKLSRLFLLVVLSVFFVTGSAMATPFGGEYKLFEGDFVGTPTYVAGTDLGYYIWADDASLTSWHIRWSGDGTSNDFDGTIAFDPNTTSVTVYSFEDHNAIQDSLTVYDNAGSHVYDSAAIANGQVFDGVEKIVFRGFADTGQDGLDLVFESPFEMPSYMAFDLHVNGSTGSPNYVSMGAGSLRPEEDFYVAAPVPEPATMILFGLGLIGVAGFGRKKLYN